MITQHKGSDDERIFQMVFEICSFSQYCVLYEVDNYNCKKNSVIAHLKKKYSQKADMEKRGDFKKCPQCSQCI